MSMPRGREPGDIRGRLGGTVLVDSEQSTSAPRSVGRLSPITLVAAILGVVPFAMHAWAASRGGLAQDDFVLTYLAARGDPFDLAYLFQDYHGHVAPGAFLLAWLVTTFAPLNHLVMILPPLVMQASASVLFWLALVRCFGRRWAILAPFAVLTTSTLLLVPTLWWAYALQVVPVLLATTAALHAHTGYLRDGRRGQLIAGFAWTIGGLAFYEKAAFIPVLLIGVSLLLGAPAARRRVVWAWHGAALVGYGVVYLLSTSGPAVNGSASAGAGVELARRMVVDTALPGLLGGPWSGPGPGVTWASPPVEVRAVLVFAAVGLLAWGVRVGGTRAWRAWALLGIAILVDIVLVAVTRLGEVGPTAGNDPRYVADIVLVAALCGAFAFLRPVPLASVSDQETPFTAHERPIALVVCAGLLLSSTVGFHQLAPALRFDHSREFVANARAAVESDPELVLFDTHVPGDIVHGWFGENSRASRVVGLVPGIRFDQPTSRIHLLDASGTPRRITAIDPVASAVPGPVAGCGHPVTDVLVRIPLDKAVLGRHLLRVDYYTAAGGEGVVDRDGHRTPVWFQAGLHSTYLPIEGLFDQIGVQLAGPGAPVCVAKIEVGDPVT